MRNIIIIVFAIMVLFGAMSLFAGAAELNSDASRNNGSQAAVIEQALDF